MLLNDEQRMLSDSLHAWLEREYTHKSWRDIADGNEGWSRQVWARFAEFGWLAAALPSEYGGLGGGAVERAVIGEAFGSALVLEPYLSTVVLGAGLIASVGTNEQRSEYLPQIAEGQLTVAFAFAEQGARFNLANARTLATKRGGACRLTGRKLTVWDAPSASHIIVLARTDSDEFHPDGFGLFLVDAHAQGLDVTAFQMIDRRRGAHLTFTDAPATPLGGAGEATLSIVEHVADQALAYVTAEACGAMRAVTDLTIDHLKQRRQFGQLLAEFQVLRHRVVDMKVQYECARSLALHAAMSADAGRHALALASAAAKSQAGRLGRRIGQEAVQMHGGMGMTDEMPVGHYLKRLMMLDTILGDADHHQRRFAKLSNTATQFGLEQAC